MLLLFDSIIIGLESRKRELQLMIVNDIFLLFDKFFNVPVCPYEFAAQEFRFRGSRPDLEIGGEGSCEIKVLLAVAILRRRESTYEYPLRGNRP